MDLQFHRFFPFAIPVFLVKLEGFFYVSGNSHPVLVSLFFLERFAFSLTLIDHRSSYGLNIVVLVQIEVMYPGDPAYGPVVVSEGLLRPAQVDVSVSLLPLRTVVGN